MTPTSFPKSAIRAVLLEGIHASAQTRLEADSLGVRAERAAIDGPALRDAIADAHLLGIRSRTKLTADLLDAAPRLLAIGCFCIGTDQVDLRAARARGIPVFNAPFSNTRSVAELTLAEIIALSRRMSERSAALHAGRWDKSASGAHEVRGRTLGIVGYGHIGSQVSVLAESLGMRVLFYDVAPKLALGNARAVASLDDLLAASDVITLHVPDTPATRGLIGPRQINQMRPGASLINNARGGVVDLSALADALREGRLSGAAVDVFPREPSGAEEPFDCPLRSLPNVILTPHIGGSTQEAQEAIGADVAAKLLRFLNVGSTLGAVNVPEVDLPSQQGPDARRHRVLHFHRNVPGVLSKMHRLIADLGANVAGEYLRTLDDLGYVVLDVDPTDSAPIVDGLRTIPETIRVRELW
ncbi:MAG: phosphoglycerate dehydrogenase [Phycisphaeraceae bacterium]|nr:phosphoglycerate dehydrogenase [Phycisphaeraceae bacterium]